MIKEFLPSYKILKCSLSLKVHFLHSYVDFVPENLAAVCKEFYQDVIIVEQQGKRKWNPAMMCDCY
jgi:hypothetical protein